VGSVTIGEIDAEFDHTSGEIPRPATDNSVKFTDALTKLDQVNANVHVKTVTGAGVDKTIYSRNSASYNFLRVSFFSYC
jgi:hypothetical protein